MHTKGHSYFFGIGFLLWPFVLNLTVFSLLNSGITFQSLVINVQLHVQCCMNGKDISSMSHGHIFRPDKGKASYTSYLIDVAFHAIFSHIIGTYPWWVLSHTWKQKSQNYPWCLWNIFGLLASRGFIPLDKSKKSLFSGIQFLCWSVALAWGLEEIKVSSPGSCVKVLWMAATAGV